MEPLVLRADAGPHIGTGHVMRSLALAQAWQDRGGRVVLVAREVGEALRERVQSEGVPVERVGAPAGTAGDAYETLDVAQRVGARWVAADGYAFDAVYQQALVDGGVRVLVLDDYGHADAYPAHVVLNQNLSADPALYRPRGPGTRLLLGTDYAMLRRDFRETSPRPAPDAARSVLVTLGGADAGNVTATVLDGLAALDRAGLDVTVVTGSANPHRDDLAERLDRAPYAGRLLHAVRDMPGLMRRADVAVSAGGSTCWELAYLGVPSAVVVLTENQRAIAEALDRRSVAVNMGEFDLLTPSAVSRAVAGLVDNDARRRAMAARAVALVDGRGALRVADALLNTP